MEYLDFELPIKELEEQYNKACAIGQESEVDVSATCKQIEKRLNDTKKDIYKNLTAWQRVHRPSLCLPWEYLPGFRVILFFQIISM